MTRRLHLLRHAAAEPGVGMHDADRALTPAGRSAAAALAPRIARLAPQLVVCSPAQRTVETAEALGVEFDVHDDLYLADVGDLLEILRHAAVEDDVASVLVVGHNPGLENLARLLSGRVMPLPTAGLATLEVDGLWLTLGGG